MPFTGFWDRWRRRQLQQSTSRAALLSPSAKAWNTRLRARTRAASPIRSSTAAAGTSTRSARKCASNTKPY
jgi:hypothetical protein